MLEIASAFQRSIEGSRTRKYPTGYGDAGLSDYGNQPITGGNMNLRRTAALAAAASAAVLAVVVPWSSASAGEQGARQEQVCLVTAGHEQTLQRPVDVVSKLVEGTESYRGRCAEYGESAKLGNGQVTAYSEAEGTRPVAVGMIMTDGALDGLPSDPPTDGKYCFDVDGNGTVDPMKECHNGYENQLDLGAHFRSTVDTPYTYVLENWNPFGHDPMGIYDKPHFDVHFYVNNDAERTAIRTGPCPALTNCDDYAVAKKLPEAKYLAPDFIDVDAVEPAMGNHLVDPTAPEFNGQPFTHTWIYGAYNNKVTFYEAMVTHSVFDGLRNGSVADGCFDFKLATNFQESGWYPTKYCLRHRDNRHDITVSLENFVHRDAS
jgi:hypothetical protein